MKNITRRAALRHICTSVAVPLIAGVMMPLLSSRSALGAQAAQTATAAAEPAGARSALIVYYSRTGNTRAVAEHIQTQLKGQGGANAAVDLLEIQTVTPYPAEYRATTEQAKKELAANYRPPLSTKVADMGKYKLIFVGSPNWWSTVAPAVMTFLSEYDFSGKTIVPFVTHGGGGLGNSVQDIRNLCPEAHVLDPFAVSGNSAAASQKDVAAWLRRLGLEG